MTQENMDEIIKAAAGRAAAIESGTEDVIAHKIIGVGAKVIRMLAAVNVNHEGDLGAMVDLVIQRGVTSLLNEVGGAGVLVRNVAALRAEHKGKSTHGIFKICKGPGR